MTAAEPNWADKTIWTGDNLHVMRGMNSESVDLIYLDPPFNSKANYAAPIGSAAAGAAFKDTWTLRDVDAEWINFMESRHPVLYRVLLAAMTDSDKSYLAYMAIRLLEMHRVLKDTGTLYLHCDPTMSHYLKLLLDTVFGRKNFLGEIVWNKQNGVKTRTRWGNENESIFCYARQTPHHLFNSDDPAMRKPFSETSLAMHFTNRDENGRLYRRRVVNGKSYFYYADKGRFIGNIWNDIPSMQAKTPLQSESTGYPTQKPLSLLHRIVAASSNPGDIVFDPFCGCATTLVAADDLQRSWVGIDISVKAADLVVERIEKRQGLFRDIVHRSDLPQRTDLGRIPAYNSTANRKHLYGEQGGDCAGCSTHFAAQHLEVDHIIAVAKGGTHHLSNLQLLCGHCNRVKGTRGMVYLRSKLQMAA